jgi:hypothetical protein
MPTPRAAPDRWWHSVRRCGRSRTSSSVFLFANLYRHPQVTDTTSQAQQVVRELFAAYLDRPAELRPSFAQRPDRERAVADYIAGMTDRFPRLSVPGVVHYVRAAWAQRRCDRLRRRTMTERLLQVLREAALHAAAWCCMPMR